MNNSIVGQRRGSAPVPLSILDVAIAGKGHTATEAMNASIALARMADHRGFNRYWMAEHHSMPGVSTSSPAVLLARLIGETQRIRLGSGGMMLPNFPPLVVAEQFGLLAAMAPGRIDLGLGRAPGTDGATAMALRRGRVNEEEFPGQVQELLHFLDDDFPQGHPYNQNVFAVPGPGQDKENGVPRSFERPSVWLLGSSGYSAQLAGHMGLPFAFAAQLAPENVMMALELYRKTFRPSEVLERPYVLVCFGVSAAEREQEAQLQARCFAHSMMRMMQRKSYVLPSPEEEQAYSYDVQERAVMHSWTEKVLYGTGEQVVEKLNRYQAATQADELMVGHLGHSPQAILRSAEIVADAYEMPDRVNWPARLADSCSGQPAVTEHSRRACSDGLYLA